VRLERSDLELEVIVRRITDGEIELQPDFQRGEIWDNTRRRRLIDTILRNWYVPAVHMVRQPSGGPDLVLDGQQRLASIVDFFTNKLRVAKPDTPHEEIDDHVGQFFSQLPIELQRSVRRFPLSVVTLSDYQPDEPFELFFRLNQHYPLTPSEKRNALFGAARDQVRELVGHLHGTGLLESSTIGFSSGRMAYDDVVARTCLAIQSNTLRLAFTSKRIEDFYRNDAFSEATTSATARAGETLGSLAREAGGVRLNKATLFTWLVFCHRQALRGVTLPPDFIRRFGDRRSRVDATDESRNGEVQPIDEVIRVYSDRASYRVGDISSVLLRDIVLHLFGAAQGLPTHPDLTLPLEAMPTGDTEGFLLTLIERSDWGATL
jgi:hypothetical protein